VIRLAPEVGEALDAGRAVVALETTLVAHGFPAGEGLGVALDAERRVREAGAVPATVGVLDGRVQVGLTAEELERFAAAGESARKAGPRDLAVCIAEGVLGAKYAIMAVNGQKVPASVNELAFSPVGNVATKATLSSKKGKSFKGQYHG